MNKAFKVLWNDVRRSFVVSSETANTHGKPKKALTVVTVATLMALSGMASALTIDNDNFNESCSSLFISGNGDLTIQTNGDAGKTVIDVYEQFTSGNLQGILQSLMPHDGLSSPIGATGGKNVIDSSTARIFDEYYNGEASEYIPEQFKPIFEKWHQLSDFDNHLTVSEGSGSIVINEGTSVSIGGNGSTPFLIGVTGGDLLMNASMHWMDETINQIAK